MKKPIKMVFLFVAVLVLYISGVLRNNSQFAGRTPSLPEMRQTALETPAPVITEEADAAFAEMALTTPLNESVEPAAPKLENKGITVFENGSLALEYNLSTGTTDFFKNGRKIIGGFYSAVKLPELITSKDYTFRSVSQADNEYTVLLTSQNHPTMRQIFNLQNPDYFTVTVEVEGTDLRSNWMAPIVVEGKGAVDIGSYADVMALWIPFDNDRDVNYDASSINKSDTSYEAAAFYDNTSRNGLVIGSVTHDTWKTGIEYTGSDNKLDGLIAYGGASIRSEKHGEMVRDVEAHGVVKGDVISSPAIFAGFFEDWRTGMETYADANAKVVPMLQWNGGVVFGWNSWGAVGANLDTSKALAAADFIKDSLMVQSFTSDDTAYINLDSYWDSPLVDLERFVENVHKNGQKAGIYWSPFVDWAKDENRKVEGSNYTYSEVWLRDSNGNPVTYGNGPYTLDPTHPGTLQRMDYFIGLFKQKGFDEYIKLDFLTHAALEGRHYDEAITTGMQGINKGMAYLLNIIRSKMGSDTFISQAISPLFPYQYAHSRRISCDKFGFLYETRNVLNSSAYGWWMSGRLYSFNDPDHLALYKAWWNKNARISENEAKARVTSAIISGTVYLSGDDFTDPKARYRALKYLTNPNINNIARLGRAFRAMEGNTGSEGPDVFTLDMGNDTHYIAVFNWDGTNAAEKTIDLRRAGLNPVTSYTAVEQWSNAQSQATGSFTVKLEPAEAKLFLLKP